MKELKITIPDGYELDKENSTFDCIKLKPFDKTKITWNENKQGVEVHSNGFHFIILDRPTCSTNWHNASYLAKLQGGYLPSKEELKIVMDNLEDIKKVWGLCSNRKFPAYTWTSYEVDSDYASCAYFGNDSVCFACSKDNSNYVFPFCEVEA